MMFFGFFFSGLVIAAAIASLEKRGWFGVEGFRGVEGGLRVLLVGGGGGSLW